MSIPETGVLSEVSLREVWPHEARDFTPWLAENLAQISERLGLSLELEGTEVAIDAYSADILARNVMDDSLVLIENQLEASDHSHLGQIMTYLAGLDAKIVIWIAKSFSDAHVSAIEWLNDKTDSSQSFFALRVSAVKIGDSLPAPQFEVCCRPNEWERQLHAIANQSRGNLGEKRVAFWSHYINRHPTERQYGDANGLGYRWRELKAEEAVVAIYLGRDSVGVFVRPLRVADPQQLFDRLDANRDFLCEETGAALENSSAGHFFSRSLKADTDDRSCWDELADWLFQVAESYSAALRNVLAG